MRSMPLSPSGWSARSSTRARRPQAAVLSFTPDAGHAPYVRTCSPPRAACRGPGAGGRCQALVEPLSAREVTVLRYLCSRLTYPEIAAALYVSLNTLKSHVRSVYRKLACASRADAVDAGRRLGLI